MSPTEPRPVRVYVVLAVAILAVSSSASIVRGMVADPLAIAAWRTSLAALVLAPTLRGAMPSRSDLGWTAVAGALLGVHFWAWFASVQTTTVLRSTLLVCLTPGWTALLEWLIGRHLPTRHFLVGTAVALPGLWLLGAPGGQASWRGDVLALFAGLLFSAYLLVGQRVRQRVDASPYMALVCGWSAITLFAMSLAGGVAVTGFPAQTWVLLAAAVAVPQLLGHQGFAYAVKHVRPSTISALTLLEPVGSALLAMVVFRELPTAREWLGMGVVLAGTGLATRRG